MQIPYLKQFVAWVTDLTDRYRYNPFVQATVHIVTIQVILALLLIAVTGWAILHTQNATVGSIHNYVQESTHGTDSANTALANQISGARNETAAYTFIALILLNILFGYILIRFALAPTRNSLQFQKRFIGNVAHEIRTPLAIIKTSTEVGLMDPNIAVDVRETYQDTIIELNRISEILSNLLSFDTLIRPERMKFEPVALVPLTQTVLDRLTAFAQSRGVKLSLVVQGKPRIVMGNTVALEEVITNLVKNAVTYTPANQNGSVEVHIENDFNNRVVVCVSDTGIGIAQKDLMHIFEPFYRGDTSRARNIGSGTSGLGLAIVNEIIRLHHGTISVRSAPGEGTHIRASFPATTKSTQSDDSYTEPDEGNEITIDFS